MLIEIFRNQSDDVQTTGAFKVWVDDVIKLEGMTMELPWKNNESNVSCIPEGEYALQQYHSVKFGSVLQVMDVPDRKYILIHHGNYNRDTHGCILLGLKLIDINHDGHLDVTNSKAMIEKVMKLWDGSGRIIIKTNK